ncbi:choice-of-anchor J domain-containing protein [Xanthomarina sp. F1114]|uniref:T9SS-dependent choice-of-anchor J family protein n=1 Tax=Xanthomarina sp. F1114 TaxID=2996019 RepID=UPI00225E5D65|nr:choice-of-anchor J domain-containing protein [Xanthomarina sp. F1114]MCX7548478.1 choice-of-anchor J domain-containing protein [Xanthomarina sp. F1114]
MKQNNLKLVWLLLLFVGVFSLHAQQKSSFMSVPSGPLQLTEVNQRHFDETGFVRCATVEMSEQRRRNNPNIQSEEDFENWLAPLMEARLQRIAEEKANGTYRRTVVNIPIIFHVLSGSPGAASDLPASQIQAQIDQLNLDFNNLSGSTHEAAESAEINFIPAVVDPDGNPLAEPGIDRVYGYSGNISTSALDNTIKPATIWDRSLYANIWTAQLSGGLLGYAQFPSNSTLPGMPQDGGSELTDGVVILAGSVGSVANPGTSAPYNLGRTLTHEIGHWIGLRHIWGDSYCGNDYCDDTPQSEDANFGCPTNNQTTCDGIRDMVENYMDYSNDGCMNIFTFDQVNRIVTVLENADGISNLPNSTTGNSNPVIAFGTTSLSEQEGTGCISRDVDISVNIGLAPSADATVTFSLSGTATNMMDYELLTPSVTFPAGSNANQTLSLRIYEDGFVENDETIIVNMTLDTSGDAELATNGSETLTYTILDDDEAPISGTLTTLVDEDFEGYSDFIIDNIGDWITLDLDGLGTYASVDNANYPNAFAPMAYQIYNPATTTPAPSTNSSGGAETRNFDPHSGAKYAAAWAASPAGGVNANDDWLISPVLSLGASGSSVSFWVKALSDTYGPENYNVGVYVGSGVPTSGSDFTLISGASETAPYGTWLEDTYDLSAYNNQDIRIGIHYISSDAYMFMVDDFTAVTFLQNDVQTSVNSGTSASMHFSGNGEAYAYDSDTHNIMAGLQNNDGFQYGCADISVSREGTGTQLLENTDPTEFVMQKTFSITTDTPNATGDVTAKFYFTEDEIAGWETATGKTRAELYMIREVDGTVVNIEAATVGSFDSNVTLEANVTGLNGTFYFGPLNASLSIKNNMLNNFSMYPNPVSNQLTIKAANNMLPDNYVVYNMLGQVILSKKVTNESDLIINTSNLNNGMYFIKLTQEANQISLPFIKK